MSHTIVKASGLILLGCLGAYVVNEVRKEYDNCVDENNNLRDFIRDHELHQKQNISLYLKKLTSTSMGKVELSVFTRT